MLRPLIAFFSLFIFVLSFHSSFSQDIIQKNNGEEIKTIVLEVGKREVKYKNFDDPEFETYTIPVKEIKLIKYENGKTQVFNKLPQSYITLTGGTSNPIGIYANDVYAESREGGAASTGLYASLHMGFYLKKRWGIAINFARFNNDFESNQLEESLRYNFGGVQELNFNFENAYEGASITLGPLYSIKLAKWLTWDNKIQVGVLHLSKPSLNYYLVDNGNTRVEYQSIDGEGNALAIGVGTGFRFSISKRFAFSLNADITGGNVNHHYHTRFKETDNTGLVLAYHEQDRTKVQGVSNFNIGLGITYMFLRKNKFI